MGGDELALEVDVGPGAQVLLTTPAANKGYRCPHTAIREDASINLAAVCELTERFQTLDLVFVESGGDNLAATFSPELSDLTLYVIDVAAGDKIPRKGTRELPARTCSSLTRLT